MLVVVLGLALAACDGGGADDEGSSAVEEPAVDGDFFDGEDCGVVGYQEMIDYLSDNVVEVTPDEEESEDSSLCTLDLIWSQAEDGEEDWSVLYFGVRTFDTVSEAEEAIEFPERVSLSSAQLRDDYSAVSLGADAPEPWEEGFIWSTPDSNSRGHTEAAARISNIVAFVRFDYRMLEQDECSGEGARCGVMPSVLVTWLYEEYLPMVGENIEALIEQ